VSALREGIKQARNWVFAHRCSKEALAALARRRLVPRRVWMRIQPLGAFTIAAPNERWFTYVASRDDVLARQFAWTGLRGYEPGTVTVISRLADTGRVFVNVGAHTGVFSLLAAAVNPSLRVAAFEPNPEVFEWLTANVRANHFEERVVLRNAALSTAQGSATLFVPPFSARSSLQRQFNTDAPLTEIPVEVSTADLECTERPVDFALIDVEGHELEVLEGMRGILKTDRPHLVVECQFGDEPGLQRLRSLLAAQGYETCYHIVSSGRLEDAENGVTWDPEELNFLFVHQERELDPAFRPTPVAALLV
jgi:FkbM family methyltransferase